MAESIILEFKGAGKNEYDQVNKILGIDQATGEGDWPDGLLNHTGAVSANGDLVVYEIWENQAAQGAFMARLGPALHEVGLPEPSRMEWFDVIGQYHTHSH
jgi:hypothetical protein